jgi:hypothetical protein
VKAYDKRLPCDATTGQKGRDNYITATPLPVNSHDLLMINFLAGTARVAKLFERKPGAHLIAILLDLGLLRRKREQQQWKPFFGVSVNFVSEIMEVTAVRSTSTL